MGTVFGKPGRNFCLRMHLSLHNPSMKTLQFTIYKLTSNRHCCAQNLYSQSDNSRAQVVSLPGNHKKYECSEGKFARFVTDNHQQIPVTLIDQSHPGTCSIPSGKGKTRELDLGHLEPGDPTISRYDRPSKGRAHR